jgi:hypothetical protein
MFNVFACSFSGTTQFNEPLTTDGHGLEGRSPTRLVSKLKITDHSVAGRHSGVTGLHLWFKPLSVVWLRFIQMVAWGQVGVFFKVLRFEWFGNGVFAAEPFAEINQLAAMGAKRPVLAGKPVAGLFAGRALDRPHSYLVSDTTVLRSVARFTASSSEAPPSVRIFWTSVNKVCCWAEVRCALLNKA